MQIEAALTASHYCLCYQYATPNLTMLGFNNDPLAFSNGVDPRIVVERTTTFNVLNPPTAPVLNPTVVGDPT